MENPIITTAIVGTIASIAISLIALAIRWTGNSNSGQDQLFSAQAYKSLTDAMHSLSEQNQSLRQLLHEKESYIVYLIDNIRERGSWKPVDFWRWQHTPDTLDDDAMKSFNTLLLNALLDAFDLASFDRMLTTHVGKRRQELSTASGLRQIVFEVLAAAEREGWTDALVAAALAVNPTNEQLQNAINAR